MKKIHLIFDMYYLYYRYKYIIDSGKIRKLSTTIDGNTIDTTYFYYTIRAIENEISQYMNDENEVTVSICIDSYTDRKETSGDYKSNREGKLNDVDHYNLYVIESILRGVGYNVYKEYNAEADDLIRCLVTKYHSDFDLTYIYTPDADILVNLRDDVYVQRFKTSTKCHTLITPDNFSEIMEHEYGCRMPYNCIILFKCLCGDKSDKIPGIRGYGPKAFDRLIYSLEKDNFNFKLLVSPKNVEVLLHMKEKLITNGDKSKLEEALDSLKLVESKETDITNIIPIKNKKIDENKKVVYGKYNFNSLI